MFQMIERVSEDPPRSKEGEMLKTTTEEIEFTVECTLLEVLCVVDVKDPVVPVQLCVRESSSDSPNSLLAEKSSSRKLSFPVCEGGVLTRL